MLQFQNTLNWANIPSSRFVKWSKFIFCNIQDKKLIWNCKTAFVCVCESKGIFFPISAVCNNDISVLPAICRCIIRICRVCVLFSRVFLYPRPMMREMKWSLLSQLLPLQPIRHPRGLRDWLLSTRCKEMVILQLSFQAGTWLNHRV